MRAWKWETNSTKLALLPFVNYVGEDIRPLPESAVGERMDGCLWFQEASSQELPLAFPRAAHSRFAKWSLSKVFQGCQGLPLVDHVCFKFPLGRSTDHWRRRRTKSLPVTQVDDRNRILIFPRLCPQMLSPDKGTSG